MSTGSPLRLVLFDVDGTLVDHDAAAAAAVEQWLRANHWADSGTIAGLVSDWDATAERHFPAYRAGRTTFQGQRRPRLRDFLPRVGIDPSGWPDERLDDIFKTYLVAYEAAWRSFPDAEPCLGTLRRVAQIAVLSNGNQGQQEEKVSRTGLGRYIELGSDAVRSSFGLRVIILRRLLRLDCCRRTDPRSVPTAPARDGRLDRRTRR